MTNASRTEQLAPVKHGDKKLRNIQREKQRNRNSTRRCIDIRSIKMYDYQMRRKRIKRQRIKENGNRKKY